VVGWKVLIPFGLGWLAFFAIGRQAFGAWGRNLNTYDAVAGLVAILLLVAVWSFMTDSKKDTQIPEEGDPEPELLDAFAGGYPVPPLPHQVLPPSPRSGRTVEARVAARSDASEASEEQGDE